MWGFKYYAGLVLCVVSSHCDSAIVLIMLVHHRVMSFFPWGAQCRAGAVLVTESVLCGVLYLSELYRVRSVCGLDHNKIFEKVIVL